MAARLGHDQHLHQVLFADSLARHLLEGSLDWSKMVRQQTQEDSLGLFVGVVRLYFGHFLIFVVIAMLMMPFVTIILKMPFMTLKSGEVDWVYPGSVIFFVIWWLFLCHTVIYLAKPELERLRELRDAAVDFLPTGALERRARLALDHVLRRAGTEVLPAVMSIGGAFLLMAALAEIHALK